MFTMLAMHYLHTMHNMHVGEAGVFGVLATLREQSNNLTDHLFAHPLGWVVLFFTLFAAILPSYERFPSFLRQVIPSHPLSV